MNFFYLAVGIIVIIAIAVGNFSKLLELARSAIKSGEKKLYNYQRKQFFMTRAEHECYNALVQAVGNEYFIFAQVHLPTIIDEKIPGQDWRAARAHINRKSVDFVLCDKEYISPKLAIELDDKSHDRPDRQERDGEVERLLEQARMPLLRLKNHGHFNADELAQKIRAILQA